jgi:hypothetical protein
MFHFFIQILCCVSVIWQNGMFKDLFNAKMRINISVSFFSLFYTSHNSQWKDENPFDKAKEEDQFSDSNFKMTCTQPNK